MKTQFATSFTDEKDSSLAGIQLAKNALEKLGEEPEVVILFADIHYDYQKLCEGIFSIIKKTQLIGCSSPRPFTENGVSTNGAAIAFIKSSTHKFSSGIGKSLSYNALKSLQDASANFPKENENYPFLSALLFFDGLASKGEEAVLAASSILGAKVKFAGGAAADDLKYKKTYVYAPDKALTNAVALCLISSKKPTIISVNHGHIPLSPPLKITKAKDNIVYEIEGVPAIEIWRKYLKDNLDKVGIDFDQIPRDSEQMIELLIKYEVGLMTGKYHKVRHPMFCYEDGSLKFSCTMIEGATMALMHSDKDRQIASAISVAKDAIKSAGSEKIAGAFIFDCTCRGLYLQDRFQEAVDGIKKVLGDIPFLGFETYGEVAMELNQLSGFHSATTVIMLIPE